MVIFIFLVWKYAFCVNLIQKFKRVILRRSLGPSLECLIDNRRPPPLINFSIFFYSEHSFFTPLTPTHPPPYPPPPRTPLRLLIIGESFHPKFETIYLW